VRYGQEITVDQGLPFPGKRPRRVAAAQAEAKAREFDFEAARLEIMSSAALLFYDYYLIERSSLINRQHIALVEELLATTTARYAAGLSPQHEPLEAEVELAHLEHRELSLAAERNIITARLNTLLHRDPRAPLPPPPASLPSSMPPPLDLEVLLPVAIAARPDLLASEATVEAARLELELAHRERRPDGALMGSYSSMWNEPEHRSMLGIAFSLPVHRKRLQTLEQQAAARLAAQRSEQTALLDRLQLEVATALLELEETHHVLDLYRSRLLPAGRDHVRAALASFRVGGSPLLPLIAAERNLRDVELGFEETQTELAQQILRLEHALGLPPGALDDHPVSDQKDEPHDER
jgi:outer membrane protein TolC